MDSTNARPELHVFVQSTGQRLSGADAIGRVWSGETPPDTLELLVTGPILQCDVVGQSPQ